MPRRLPFHALPSAFASVTRSPVVLARAVTLRSGVKLPKNPLMNFTTCSKARTWSSSQRVWAAELAPARLLLFRRSPKNAVLHHRRCDPSFTFEGGKRSQSAEAGVAKMKEHAHTLISIPNDRLLQLADKKSSLQDAFRMADEVLHQGIQGISELITIPGLINLDFADVRSIMSEGGAALMAVDAAQAKIVPRTLPNKTISSQLLISPLTARVVCFSTSPAVQT